MINGDDPAYPVTFDLGEGATYSAPGLTKREQFAAIAMQGLLAGWPLDAGDIHNQWVAGTAVRLADALIVALNEERTNAKP